MPQATGGRRRRVRAEGAGRRRTTGGPGARRSRPGSPRPASTSGPAWRVRGRPRAMPADHRAARPQRTTTTTTRAARGTGRTAAAASGRLRAGRRPVLWARGTSLVGGRAGGARARPRRQRRGQPTLTACAASGGRRRVPPAGRSRTMEVGPAGRRRGRQRGGIGSACVRRPARSRLRRWWGRQRRRARASASEGLGGRRRSRPAGSGRERRRRVRPGGRSTLARERGRMTRTCVAGGATASPCRMPASASPWTMRRARGRAARASSGACTQRPSSRQERCRTRAPQPAFEPAGRPRRTGTLLAQGSGQASSGRPHPHPRQKLTPPEPASPARAR